MPGSGQPSDPSLQTTGCARRITSFSRATLASAAASLRMGSRILCGTLSCICGDFSIVVGEVSGGTVSTLSDPRTESAVMAANATDTNATNLIIRSLV